MLQLGRLLSARFCLSPFFFSFALLFSSAFAFFQPPLQAEQELLSKAKISQIMGQILDQHISKEGMSPELLQKSINRYINHFDPYRVYLLEAEVAPYFNLAPNQLLELQKQYQSGNYSIFEQIDQQIARSIQRARSIRRAQEVDIQQLFDRSADMRLHNLPQPAPQERPFATTTEELQNRINQQIEIYLHQYIDKYGKTKSYDKRYQLLGNYEAIEHNRENPFLYQQKDGVALTSQAKENLFAINVLKAMAESLDSHTDVFNPQEATDLRERLQKAFYGVGLQLKKDSTGITVEKIYPNSPAARDGKIAEGDRIVEVDGKSVHKMDLDEIYALLRNKEVKKINLLIKKKIDRDPSTANLTFVSLSPSLITLDEGRVKGQYQKTAQGGILATITIPSFYKGEGGISTSIDLLKEIKRLQTIGPIEGMILDLRDNSGGFLTEAVRVAGIFISNGIVVISQYANGQKRLYRDIDAKTYYNGPLILLTSKLTASAAEIVAQALQDWGVGLVVGDEQTFGKGTIQSQTVTDGAGDSFFKVTVGKYYTVSGKTPQLEGVKADIIVPGEYAFDKVGEEYVSGAVGSDLIAARYEDNLADIDRGMQNWFARYYTPTLQKKQKTWSSVLPKLRNESLKRQRNNQDYRSALEGIKNGGSPELYQQIQQLQLQEALNILKDMVALKSAKAY